MVCVCVGVCVCVWCVCVCGVVFVCGMCGGFFYFFILLSMLHYIV